MKRWQPSLPSILGFIHGIYSSHEISDIMNLAICRLQTTFCNCNFHMWALHIAQGKCYHEPKHMQITRFLHLLIKRERFSTTSRCKIPSILEEQVLYSFFFFLREIFMDTRCFPNIVGNFCKTFLLGKPKGSLITQKELI